jgi:tripartite-type tricarboxylate transporter receptor subunit TctC
MMPALPALATGGVRAATDWPARPVRLVVPFPPGGSTDILGRSIAQKLQEALGQPFIVENRPGAGGSIGATEVARAAPDGYALLMGHIGTLAINPSLYAGLAYDPVKSFAPVALIALLNAEVARALQTPALKARLDAEGADAAPTTPEAFGALIVSEIARWKPVIEQSRMRPD